MSSYQQRQYNTDQHEKSKDNKQNTM